MTRLAGIGRGPALGLIVLLLALIGYGLSLPQSAGRFAQAPGQSDAALYRAIDDRMTAGAGYYEAAAAEHRARNYPLRPFVTMRLPTLAWLRGAVGRSGAMLLLAALALAVVVTAVVRLRGMLPSRLLWGVAAMVATLSAVPLVQPVMTLWHEAWAGLLVALALACRGERRWWPSVLFGLAAVLVRELALPLLAAMMLCALVERRRAETIGWMAATLVFGVALAFHAHAVAAVVTAGDHASPGWATIGGWRFILSLAHGSTLFAALPAPLTAILLPIALLGWAATRGGLALRVSVTLGLWIAAFLLIGRADNFYWGLLMAPLLPLGLVLALPALTDLLRAATAPVGARVQAFASP